MEQIFELSEVDKITGSIYIITNTENQKCYIGQTRSHRLNKGKYRPFGIIGRFNDHVSEAINNTKKNQCTYLNNAIRKYGKDKFTVTLLETCTIDLLNSKEADYISKYNSLYPNGFNLTKGGKDMSYTKAKEAKVLNNSDIAEFKCRGRGIGYTHSKDTIDKIKLRLNEPKLKMQKTITMKDTMTDYYDTKKVDILNQYTLIDDVKTYIKPVKLKNSDEIHDYIIRINKRKLTVRSNDTLENKYNRLLNILNLAKNKQENNKVKIVEIRENKMDNQQPLT